MTLSMRGNTLKHDLLGISGSVEPHAGEVSFKIHKLTKRIKPIDPRNIIIFPCFSEFGTEILGTLYCLPFLLQKKYVGKYSIAVGWKGRAFLYKNIVDEFWEIDDDHQWLREYCRAFHHCSRNLERIEKGFAKVGRVVSALEMGEPAIYPKLKLCLVNTCGGEIEHLEDQQQCRKCHRMFPKIGIFQDPKTAKRSALWPIISPEKINNMAKYIKPNSIGITARNRVCYNRNLPIDFYERLICLLEDMGYEPIWLGEKQTILPCPFPRIVDFSSTDDANDLENTLALVSQLKFTIQFWTASTRLAGLVGTPFILFESPNQIYGAHEGYRIYLCSRGPKKLVLSQYNTIAQNNDLALNLAKQAVKEINEGNFNDIGN